MAAIAVLLVIALLIAPVILSIVAMTQVGNLRAELRTLEERLAALTPRHEAPPAPAPRQEKPIPHPAPPPPMPAPVVAAPPPEHLPAAAPVAVPQSALPVQQPMSGMQTPINLNWVEENIGKRWITWVGVLALFLSIAFFVKYAIENQWLGPTGRVVLGILVGIVLLIIGDRSIRRQWRALGEGLIGGGLAITYVSLFAAFTVYDLIPAEIAFAAMAILTISGMTLAIQHNAIALSVLAVLGGMLTPVMISTGSDARDVLFTYLLLLDLGVLGIAFFKQWRALEILTFASTWLLFLGWYEKHYTVTALAPTVTWVYVFYFVFLVLPFIYHLRYKIPVTVERFIMALVNSSVAFAFAYAILAPQYRIALGFVALGMSVVSLFMGSLTRRRLPTDAMSLFGFITLAVTFLTMAIPLQLRAYGISLAWAVEGPALLYLGYRYRYYPVRVGGFLVLILAVMRLFIAHWPLHSGLFEPFANKNFLGAICIPLTIAAYALIHHLWRKQSTRDDWSQKIICAVGAGALGLFLIQAEIGLWLDQQQLTEVSRFVTAAIWAAGGVSFISAGLRIRNFPVQFVGVVLFIIASVLCIFAYQTDTQYTALFANPRFGAVLLVGLALFLSWWLTYRQQADRQFQLFLFGFLEAFLFIIFSMETYTWGSHRALDEEKARGIAQMSLSITWGVYAIALLAVGFLRRSRGVRITALCFFGLTALKLLAIDISSLAPMNRIISFFIIGLLMIGASYLYHRIEKHLAETTGGTA